MIRDPGLSDVEQLLERYGRAHGVEPPADLATRLFETTLPARHRAGALAPVEQSAGRFRLLSARRLTLRLALAASLTVSLVGAALGASGAWHDVPPARPSANALQVPPTPGSEPEPSPVPSRSSGGDVDDPVSASSPAAPVGGETEQDGESDEDDVDRPDEDASEADEPDPDDVDQADDDLDRGDDDDLDQDGGPDERETTDDEEDAEGPDDSGLSVSDDEQDGGVVPDGDQESDESGEADTESND